jgi:hypothetical protein
MSLRQHLTPYEIEVMRSEAEETLAELGASSVTKRLEEMRQNGELAAISEDLTDFRSLKQKLQDERDLWELLATVRESLSVLNQRSRVILGQLRSAKGEMEQILVETDEAKRKLDQALDKRTENVLT